jgi:hypothetical protein
MTDVTGGLGLGGGFAGLLIGGVVAWYVWRLHVYSVLCGLDRLCVWIVYIQIAVDEIVIEWVASCADGGAPRTDT